MEEQVKESFIKNNDIMITIVGAPFSVHKSSCSNHKPKTFNWCELQTTNEVFMDYSIASGVETERIDGVKRFAWLCESNAIVPEIREMFDNENFYKLIDAYYGIFTCDRTLVDRHDKIHFCFAGSNLPWTKNYKIHNKSKIVSFIASSKLMCEGHQFRHDLHERFKKRDESVKEVEYRGKIYKQSSEQFIDVY